MYKYSSRYNSRDNRYNSKENSRDNKYNIGDNRRDNGNNSIDNNRDNNSSRHLLNKNNIAKSETLRHPCRMYTFTISNASYVSMCLYWLKWLREEVMHDSQFRVLS